MHVIPRPLHTTRREGSLRLTPGSPVGVSCPTIGDLATIFVDDVERDLGLRLQFDPIGGADDAAPGIRLELDAGVVLPELDTAGLDPNGGGSDERYRLLVDHAAIRVSACTTLGLSRGLATLRQLLQTGRSDEEDVIVDAVEIIDGPRIAWRGLSLDVARCFLPVGEVRRVIDMLSLYKLNVLHMHLTDDAGWRLEIPGRPRLTEIGGAALDDRPGGYYTQAEFRELVGYAERRGVTIIPEIDMPGHSAAAIRAYPELSQRTAEQGSWLPVNLLEPDTEGVLEFAHEVATALADAAPGPYVHLGGDEAFGMDPAAYCRFLDAVREIVTAAGKRMIVWQEGARASIAPGDVVQHWLAFDESLESLLETGRLEQLELPEGLSIPAEMIPVIAELFRVGRADLDRAIERGAKVILSPAAHVYLDKPYAEAPADPEQVPMQQRVGLRVYSPVTIEQSFAWDPSAAIAGGLDSVAGVEAAIWGETISSAEEMQFLVLPRLLAIADKSWSPEPLSEWSDFRQRLAQQSPLWRRRQWTWFTSSLVDWK